MDGIVDSFMHWSSEVGKHGLQADVPKHREERVQGFRRVDVVDAFRKFSFSIL